MAYDNTNRGMIAKNTTATNANSPDYKGSLDVNGVEFWVSAWVQDGKAGSKMEGKKYLSLSVQPKEQQSAARSAQPKSALEQKAATADLTNPDDLPF